MGPINTDKLVFNKTIIGVMCPCCGGALCLSKEKTTKDKVLRIISFGLFNPKSYCCKNCQKKYTLF